MLFTLPLSRVKVNYYKIMIILDPVVVVAGRHQEYFWTMDVSKQIHATKFIIIIVYLSCRCQAIGIMFLIVVNNVQCTGCELLCVV
jgi:hypothetical protein